MGRTFSYAISLLALLLALPGTASAGMTKFSTPWVCPTTYEAIEPSLQVSLGYDDDTGEVDASAFKSLLSQAASKFPDVDYTSCAEEFWKKVWIPLPNEAYRRLTQELDIALINYRTAAAARGAVSPFEPAESRKPSLSLDSVNQITKGIESNCGASSYSHLDVDVLRGLKEIMSKPTVSSICRKRIADSFAGLLVGAQLSAKACKANPKNCAKRKDAVARALRLLAEAGIGEEWKKHAPTAEEACGLIKDRAVDWSAFNTQLSEMLGVMAKVSTLSECKKLNPGQSIIVDGNAGTGIAAKYAITRVQKPLLKPDVPEAYRVTVNFKFIDPNFVPGIPVDRPLDLEGRFRACLKEVNEAGMLRGPQGEQLEIGLWEPVANKNTKPAEVKIEIKDKAYRSNMTVQVSKGAWAESIDCATMLHETLHALGLVDHYPEASGGVKVTNAGFGPTESGATHPWFNCRIPGPPDSIMSYHWEGFAGSSQAKVRYCECAKEMNPIDRQKCLQDLAAIGKESASKGNDGPSTCPTGTNSKTLNVSRAEAKHGYSEEGPLAGVLVRRVEEIKTWKGNILYPAEFRVISQPGCLAANETYYRCSNEAYKTSKENFGSQACAVELPASCLSKDYQWLK